MFGRLLTIITLAAAIIVLILLQSTNPSQVGPVGILAVFFLLYVISVGCFTWLFVSGSWLMAQIARPIFFKKPVHRLSVDKGYYFASLVALAPVMLVGMSSVGKLSIYEVGLVILFVVISVFYVQKRMYK